MVRDISQWSVRPKGAVKPPSKKEVKEKAEQEYRYWLAMLQAHQHLWKAKWDSAPNPFVAWAQYKADRPIRQKILIPYLAAKEKHFSVRDR